jgi:hypothetical protein
MLRREGLYSSLVGQWSKQRDQGVLSGPRPRRGRPEVDPREREAARLRKEIDLASQAARVPPRSAWWVAAPYPCPASFMANGGNGNKNFSYGKQRQLS